MFIAKSLILTYFSRFAHPNVVGFIGVILEKPMRIVMEKMDGGSLWDFLHHQLKEDATSCLEDGKDAQWSLRLRIALDVARGVEAMHNHSPPIIHRDLRSPNILVSFLR